jgi:hypothetical protein
MTLILLIIAAGALSGLVVTVFRAYVKQQVAAAELSVHTEYSMLVEGLEKDANTLKTEILSKYDNALRKLVDEVKSA